MRVVLFGGTTEGRQLARELGGLPLTLQVSVATPLGKEELAGLEQVEILTGRLSAEEMAELLQGAGLCIDATHPYAVEVSGNIRLACEKAGISLRRLVRPQAAGEEALTVDSCAQAARFLAAQEGNILLTTGAKELSAFAGVEKTRLYARVLPTAASIAACEALGLAHRNIIAMEGPFTRRMNEAMLEQYHIRWMVTKDGGAPGGMEEKLAAARAMGVRVVLVRRPREQTDGVDSIPALAGCCPCCGTKVGKQRSCRAFPASSCCPPGWGSPGRVGIWPRPTERTVTLPLFCGSMRRYFSSPADGWDRRSCVGS